MRSLPIASLLLLSLVATACSSSAEAPTGTAEGHATESPWKFGAQVGYGPGQDIFEMERSSLALDAQGLAHVAFADHSGRLGVATVDESGVPHADTIDVGGLYSAIAIDASGREHIAHFQNGPVRVRYAQRKEDGSFLTEETPLQADTNLSIAVGPDGTTHIAAYDYANNQIDYVSRTQAGTWSTPERIDAGHEGPQLAFLGGELHVLYQPTLQGPVKDAHKSAGAWVIEPVALGDKLAPAVAVVDAHGALHVAAGLLDGTRKIAHATRAPGGAWSAAEALGQGDGVGAYHISIAADPRGPVRIVSAGNEQRILSEHVLENGAWTSAYVGHYGELPSLAIDAQGRSHLTYRTNGAFFYASRAR